MSNEKERHNEATICRLHNNSNEAGKEDSINETIKNLEHEQAQQVNTRLIFFFCN